MVTIERISREEALDIYTKATLNVYCREFGSDCQSGKDTEIENEIKRVLPIILIRRRQTGYAKITYRNGTDNPITCNAVQISKWPPGPGDRGIRRLFTRPKIQSPSDLQSEWVAAMFLSRQSGFSLTTRCNRQITAHSPFARRRQKLEVIKRKSRIRVQDRIHSKRKVLRTPQFLRLR